MKWARRWLCGALQAGAGLGHLMTTIEVLKNYPFEERLGSAMIVREPIGVVRPDHAVELAAEPDRLQGRARRSPPAAPWC